MNIATSLNCYQNGCDFIDLDIYDDLSVTVTFDIIDLSFPEMYTKTLFSFLKSSGFVNAESGFLDQHSYRKYRVFKRGSDSLRIFFGKVPNKQKNYDHHLSMLKLHSPSNDLVLLIAEFVEKLPKHTLSKVEVAFDFFSQERFLKDIQLNLESILHKPYRQKPCTRFPDDVNSNHTFYLSSHFNGKVSNFIRLYIKKKTKCVRLELTLNYISLHRKHIKRLSDLPKVWELDLSHYFVFRKWDDEKLIEYALKKRVSNFREQQRKTRVKAPRGDFRMMKGIGLTRREVSNRCIRGEEHGFICSCVFPWLTETLYDDEVPRVARVALAEQEEAMKRLVTSDYNRFLIPTQEELYAYLENVFISNI